MNKKRPNLHAGLFTGTAAGFVAGVLLFLPGVPFVSFLFTALEVGLQAVYGLSAPLSSKLDSVPGILLLFTGGGALMGLANALVLGSIFALSRKVLKRDAGFRFVFASHAGLVVAQNILLYGLIWLGNIAHTLAPVTFRFLWAVLLVSAFSGITTLILVLAVAALLHRRGRSAGPDVENGTGGEGRLLFRIAFATLLLVLAVALAGIGKQSLARRRIVPPPAVEETGRERTGDDSAGFSRGESGESGESGLRLLLVGIDGVDWAIVNDLCREGRLPNLESIIKKGSTAGIRSVVPNLSPLVWTSVATGRRPQKHGVFGFYNIETGGEELYNSLDVKVESFWDILSKAGTSIGVVNWYVSWPARPVRGFLVSDRFAFPGLPGRIYPEAAVPVVDSILADLPPQLPGIDPSAAAGLDDSIARLTLDSAEGRRMRAFRTLENALFRDAASLETAVELYSRNAPRALAVYFRCTDVASHLFWKHRMALNFPGIARRLYSTEPSAVDSLTERMLIEAVYEWNDRALGRLLELTSENTLVCVLSDHGFGFKLPGQYSYDMNKLLSRMGLLAFEEDGGRVDLSRSSLFDCRVSTGIVNLVKKMQVAVDGRDTFADEAGRELFFARAVELRAKLEGLRTIRGERFFGELAIADGGDRIFITGMVNVGFLNQQVRIDGAAVPAEEFLVESDISGWHRNDGFFAVSGPGIRSRRISRCSELDIAPTLLHYLGYPVPLDMDGRVLTGIFDSGSRRKVDYCAGYGIVPPSEVSNLPDMGDSVEESIREQLQALGYVQ